MLACVTGGNGMVGKHIVTGLLRLGFQVRVLTRQPSGNKSQVEYYQGDICDRLTIRGFLSGANLVFHCAAELNDEHLMWDVNVNATESLLSACKAEDVEYFCYLSSAGVIGKTKESFVSEDTECSPQSVYECSKLAADKLVFESTAASNIVILRPTNVINLEKPGALLLSSSNGVISRLKILLKGRESAHLVHAEDVAAAALFFCGKKVSKPECYFVSCDSDSYNTFAGLFGLYHSLKNHTRPIHIPFSFPLIVPYLLRRFVRGRGNLGSVIYSSEKLIGQGFVYKFDVKKMVHEMVQQNEK